MEELPNDFLALIKLNLIKEDAIQHLSHYLNMQKRIINSTDNSSDIRKLQNQILDTDRSINALKIKIQNEENELEKEKIENAQLGKQLFILF